MSRLVHSYAGHLRSMQISSTGLFVFVEGRQCDPYFYARILDTVPGLGMRYELCLAEQLPGGAGGKHALLSFYEYLRKQKSLVSTLAGHTTVAMFFMDKDVDDLQRKRKRSQHVVYTEHYDVHNYVFLHGDLKTGAAAAASVDPARLTPSLGHSNSWCVHAAELWRDWVALCLRMLEDGITCEANYRVLSRVQCRPSQPTDPALYATLSNEIANRAGVSLNEFNRRIAVTIRKVDAYYRKGFHHRIFKGKWFSPILADEIDKTMTGYPYDSRGLDARLPCAIAATLDFRQPWADYFRKAIQRVVQLA